MLDYSQGNVLGGVPFKLVVHQGVQVCRKCPEKPGKLLRENGDVDISLEYAFFWHSSIYEIILSLH